MKYLPFIYKKLKVYKRALHSFYSRLTLHSRIVFFLRVALPSFVALFLGLIIIVPNIDDKVKDIKISFPSIDTNEKISFTMDNGNFYGQGDNDTLFSVNVENSKEDKEKEMLYFTKIKGKIFLKNGGWIDISTNNGNYTKTKNLFSMNGDIYLFDSDNNKIYTDEADVNLKDMSVSGDKPIKAITDFGEIEGDGFYFKKGDVYKFLGKIRGHIDTSKIEKSK